jgi:multiple antibiotic resistance protein
VVVLSWPGTSVIISYETSGLIVTIISIAIVIGITYLILLFINSIYRLGRRRSMIVTRVFAVFIVQYVVEDAKRLLI